MPITTRAAKGYALTHAEMDANLAAVQALVSGAGILGTTVTQLLTGLQRAPMFDSVMSSPPTFSESADFASGSLGGALIPLDDARITQLGRVGRDYQAQGRWVFTAVSVGGGNFAFITDAIAFEIDLQTSPVGNPCSVIVDGVFATTVVYNGTPPGSGNIRRQWKVTFPSRKMRRIIILNSGNGVGIAGIFVGPQDTVLPYKPVQNFGGVAVLGDSYAGYGFQPVTHGGPAIGIMDALSYSGAVMQYGASGYFATNGNSNYLTRLQKYVTVGPATPGAIITMGGINDDNVASNTQVAINAYYAWCSANLPDALHIVTGPFCPSQTYISGTDKYTNITGWIKSALVAFGVKKWVFLDTIFGGYSTSWGKSVSGTGPWITGEGQLVTFTASVSAATTATLSVPWNGSSGVGFINFSDGSTKSVTLTNGSASVAWIGAVTATNTANAYRTDGNAKYYISNDGTHPVATSGVDFFARRAAFDLLQALSV